MLKKIDPAILNFAISLYIPGFFVNLGFSIVSPLLSKYAVSFGVPLSVAAMVITANALGRILADIPLGTLCDRIGRRPLAIAGPLLVTISAILCAQAQSFYELLIYRAIGGAAMSMWMIARQAMIADSIDPSIRGRIMSTFMSVNMVGSAAGPAIGGIIYEVWKDYRVPFYFYGLSTFASLIACLALVKETTVPKKAVDKENQESAQHIGEILKYFNFMILIAAFSNFFNHIRFAARGFLVPLFGYDILHLGAGEVGLVLSVSTIINIIIAFPGGFIVDRYGRKASIVSSLLISAIAYALLPFSTGFLSFLLLVGLQGVAGGIGGGATMAMAADLAPAHLRGVFLGFWQIIGDVGSAVGPIILGIIADSYGLTNSFYGTAILLAVGVTTTQLFVKETLSKKR